MIYTRLVDEEALPMYILCSKNRKWEYFHFSSHKIIRNGKLYWPGYVWGENAFFIAIIDLAVAFPDL